jgi:serine/threonine protein kinase
VCSMADAEALKAVLTAGGKFRIKKEILGGMNATALLAYHTHLRRDVFLKIYDYVEEYAAEALREPRLLVEATRNPPKSENIVEVFDTEVIRVGQEKYLCLQMEFIKGENLEQVLEAGPVAQQDAVRIAGGILRGVLHLHRSRMVHRDLKPANILLASGVPKIADFGSVAVVPDAPGSVTASRHSALYVPPEGWGSPSIYSYESAIYQVGVVLHELVNGHLRYDDEHYLTSAVVKALLQPFAEMDSYDQSKAVDRSIAELARKGTLLKHGGVLQPYLSKKIARAVRSATNPNAADRASGPALLEKLSSISVPNWRPLPDGRYEAKGWRNWDLLLEPETRKGVIVVVLKRSKVGADNFRRFKEFETVEAAARFAEEQL